MRIIGRIFQENLVTIFEFSERKVYFADISEEEVACAFAANEVAWLMALTLTPDVSDRMYKMEEQRYYLESMSGMDEGSKQPPWLILNGAQKNHRLCSIAESGLGWVIPASLDTSQ